MKVDLDQRYMDYYTNGLLPAPEEMAMIEIKDAPLRVANKKAALEKAQAIATFEAPADANLKAIWEAAKSLGINLPVGFIEGTIASPKETINLIKGVVNMFNDEQGKGVMQKFVEGMNTPIPKDSVFAPLENLPTIEETQSMRKELIGETPPMSKRPAVKELQGVMPNIEQPFEEMSLITSLAPEFAVTGAAIKGGSKLVKGLAK
jgi:hypothetical protein